MEKYQNEKYLDAVELFQLIVYNHPGESLVDTAQYYLAMSYHGNEDYILARVEFNRLLLNYPSSDFAVRSQFMKAVCFYESTPDHYGLDQTDVFEAIKQFEDFLIDHPESELIPQAQEYLLKARTRLAHKYYEAGMVYMHINAFKAAKIYFQLVIDDYTDTEYAPKATFNIARAELKLKNYEAALAQIENFSRIFPDHEWIPGARDIAAEILLENGIEAYDKNEYEQAREYFKRIMEGYPDSDEYREAFFRFGETAYHQGDIEIARETFVNFQNTYDKNRWSRKVRDYLERIASS